MKRLVILMTVCVAALTVPAVASAGGPRAMSVSGGVLRPAAHKVVPSFRAASSSPARSAAGAGITGTVREF